jgi:pimeloyl-ACP methyl ester carboxylesterase
MIPPCRSWIGRAGPAATSLLLAFGSFVHAADGPFTHPPPDLASLVQDYMTAGDADQADRLLGSILRHPDATVPTVRQVLQAGRPYTRAPVGLQPNEPIGVRGGTYRFGLYVPPSYEPTKDYALVVCLHGAGFTGDQYLERWRVRLGDDYILACPTIPQGAWWTRTAEDLVLATIAAVQSRYRIDPDRIFLTGMSNGGIGAWIIGAHHAARFAGLAPMAGGLDDVLFPFLSNLRWTPVYVIHGLKDQVMPVDLSRSITKELARLGYSFVYREHDRTHPIAGGHYFPREELPDLVAWFGTQRRIPLPARMTVVRDASHLLPFGWVRIDATDRIAAFSENLLDDRDDAIRQRLYARLEAEIVGPNRIEVRSERVRQYTLFLNERLVDLSRPVTVVTNGRTSYEGPVSPNVETLLRQARLRQDPGQLFSTQVTVAVERAP